MRFLFYLTILLLSVHGYAQTESPPIMDITGHYTMDNRQKAFSGKMRGFKGVLKIKKLNDTKIVVRLNVEGAADDQGDGYLYDTLKVENNKAIYRNPEADRSCRVIFSFNDQGVKVEDISDNYNVNCGFGHGARVDGFYKKVGTSVPTDKELKE